MWSRFKGVKFKYGEVSDRQLMSNTTNSRVWPRSVINVSLTNVCRGDELLTNTCEPKSTNRSMVKHYCNVIYQAENVSLR